MEKKPKSFIIDVIPLTRLPLSRQQHFSYEFEHKLPAGTLVNIPLFRRFLSGIVINSRDDFHPHTKSDKNNFIKSKLQQADNINFGVGVNRLGNIYPIKSASPSEIPKGSEANFTGQGGPASQEFNGVKLKKIANIIEENFLTAEQLKLAQFISDYYICPLGIVLKFFVPKRVKSKKQLVISNSQLGYKKIKLTKGQKNAVAQITNYKLPITNYLLFGPASSGKTEVYIHSILKLAARNPKSQFLILLPELTLTPQAIERYGAHFKPEEIVVLHSKIPGGEFYENWKKIKSGEAKIIIGTRMAVFVPFQNLKLIVIDEEQDISFKQWNMNPRYDARKVAEKLAEIHGAGVVLGSAAPSIETYYGALQRKYKLLRLSHLEIKSDSKFPISNFQFPNKFKIQNSKFKILPPVAEIVDMRKERWIRNFSPISKKLQSEISYALKNKLQAILFINRRGISHFSVCDGCKSILKCPNCDRALVLGNTGNYQCLHCSYKTGAFAVCLKCKGINFRNIGIGTQKIERELEKLFPEAKIKRADFESMKKRGKAEELYQEFNRGDFDILVGTQMITKGWDNPKVGLVGILDADNLLNISDFKTDEKAFQLIVQAIGRTGRAGSKFPGKVIIQTFNPEGFVIQAAASSDYESFFKKEAEERKILGYPPFSRVILLINRQKSKERVEKEAGKIYNEIAAIISQHENIIISRPQDSLVSKIRGQFRKQIVIRIKDFSDFIPQELKNALAKLGSDWIIDIDPISII